MAPAARDAAALERFAKLELQRDEAQRSIGMAMQNMMLAAKAMGYESCPMIGYEIDEVAKLADVPRATLYYYFSGKDEILFFCQQRSLDLLLAELERVTSGPPAVTSTRSPARLR